MAWISTLHPQSDDVIIRSVTLDGNDKVSIKEVLYLIRQRPPNLFFRRPEFDSRLLKLDALTLKSYYHSKGFLDADVQESYIIENGTADIIYKIQEGKQYYLSSIEIIGNNNISNETIINILGLRIDKPYDPVFINDNLFKVENEYHQIGKLFFTIQVLDEITDSVNVKIEINEGKDVFINKTYFEKIGSIDSNLVWREITYKKGDLYTKKEMDITSRRIKEMGVFSMANMVPVKVADSDSLVNMVIEFRRYKQREWNSVGGYDPIRFAEGAEPLPALSGTLEWRNRSFFNTPTQFSTKILAGIPVEEELILPRIRYDLSLASNWFFGIRFPTKITGYYETFIEYKDQIETIERLGVNLSQRIQFESRSYFETKSVWESFSDQSVSNENIEQRSIGFRLNIDRKDNPLFTRKGYLFLCSFKSAGSFLGGERDYTKTDFTFQSYIPIGKKSVFASRLKIGRLWGWKKEYSDYSYEKFYLGGSTSMRGWDVLRFEEVNGEPVGKLIRLMANVEYRLSLYKLLGLTMFLDGGLLANNIDNISRKIFKLDTGIGLTIQTPLGPARVDYAFQTLNPNNWKIQLGVQNLF